MQSLVDVPGGSPDQSLPVRPPATPVQSANLSTSSLSPSRGADPAVMEQYLSDARDSLVPAILGRIESFRVTVSKLVAAFPSKVFSDETWGHLELSKLAGKIIKAHDPHEDSDREDRGEIFHTRLLEAASLIRTLRELPSDPKVIQIRQDAIRELHENPRLARKLENVLSFRVVDAMVSVMRGPGGGFTERFPATVSGWYADNRNAFKTFSREFAELPSPRSPLLQSILSDIRSFIESETVRLHCEGMRLTPDGAVPAGEPRRGFFDFRFRPLAIHPLRTLPLYLPPITFAAGFLMTTFAPGEGALFGIKLMKASMFLLAAAATYVVAGGIGVKSFVCDELKEKAHRDVPRALSGMALIREFLALNRFADSTTHPTGFCRIIDSPDAMFVARRMGSPLRPEHTTYVYNDADIAGRDPVLLMGPNSGGKTSWLKDVLPNWVLGQTGARALLEEGSISPATKFVYSVPKQNDSSDEHGRFGVELAWVRPALDELVDSKTVFIFDEIGSGTAEAASAPIGVDLLSTFRRLRLRTVVATHNLSLKKAILDAKLPVKAFHPEILIVEGPDGTREADSSHRILPGFPPDDIPSELGARRVMSKLGLARPDLKSIVARHVALGRIPEIDTED